MAVDVTFNPLALRRSVMLGQKTGGVNGWNKRTITADADYTAGSTVTSLLSGFLPNEYRYAVVLADDTAEPEDGAFLGAVFLPTRADVHGVRWRSGAYDQRLILNAGGVDCRLMQGETVSMYWRTEPIGNDEPETDWNYTCLTTDALSTAAAVKQELTGVGSWGLMISVLDFDFTSIPATHQAYCESITIDSSSMTGTWIRSNNGTSYSTGSNWAASYGLKTEAGSKIACFYI